jgi:hypothetical protein
MVCMKKILVTFTATLVLIATFSLGWLCKPDSPKPQIAYGKIFESASSWCEKRISELPPGDQNRAFFERSLEDIENRNIRWSIETPTGLHYSLLADFAEAWDNRS